MKTVAEELGLGFAGIGFQPKWSVAETPIMPKVVISERTESVLLGLSMIPSFSRRISCCCCLT